MKHKSCVATLCVEGRKRMIHDELELSVSTVKTLSMKTEVGIFTLTKTDKQAILTMERIGDSDVHVRMDISHETFQRIIDFWEE
jgi:hypothetical protein